MCVIALAGARSLHSILSKLKNKDEKRYNQLMALVSEGVCTYTYTYTWKHGISLTQTHTHTQTILFFIPTHTSMPTPHVHIHNAHIYTHTKNICMHFFF